MSTFCNMNKFTIHAMYFDECPICVREERDRLRDQVAMLMELDDAGFKREQELRYELGRYRDALEEIRESHGSLGLSKLIATKVLEGK